MQLRKDQQVIASEVRLANNAFSRAKGLLGTKTLAMHEVLWIRPCNNIHTFFMNFPIDVVFVDRSLIVRKIYPNVKPSRLIWPFWKPTIYSTFECASGFLEQHPLREGDQLHVDP